MKKKERKKEDYTHTTIITRISPELRKEVERVAEIKSWSLSKTTEIALAKYVATIK